MADKGLYIPPEILADSQLGSSSKMVYAVMVESAESDGFVRITSPELGARTGMTSKAAVHNRWILRKLGYVEPIPKTKHNYRIVKWPGGRRDG